MESPLSFFRMRWDHEPVEIPLTRPSDTLSPSGGEGRGEGVRWFTERKAGRYAASAPVQLLPQPAVQAKQ